MKTLIFYIFTFIIAISNFGKETIALLPIEKQIIGMWCNLDSQILVDNERYEEIAENEKPYFDFMEEYQYSFYWFDSKKEWGKYKILKDQIILYDRMIWTGHAFYEKGKDIVLSNVYISDNKLYFNHPLETKALVITKGKDNKPQKRKGESMFTPFLYKEKSVVMSRIIDKKKLQYFRGKRISRYLLKECMLGGKSASLLKQCIPEKEE